MRLFGRGTDRFALLGGSVARLLLSASTILDNASIGATIGTLSVQGGKGSYTYSLTSNPGSLFSISGSSLQVAASLSAQDGSHAITVQANNGAGSIITQPFLITVLSSASAALEADFSAASNEPWGFW